MILSTVFQHGQSVPEKSGNNMKQCWLIWSLFSEKIPAVGFFRELYKEQADRKAPLAPVHGSLGLKSLRCRRFSQRVAGMAFLHTCVKK
jgi:hypothetical protein